MTRHKTDPARVEGYGDPSTFDKFRRLIPAATIRRALQAGKVRTKKCRRLPLERVLWIPVAMALFACDPLEALVARLRLARPGNTRKPVGGGAISQARERLGPDAMRALFTITARRWADRSARRAEVRWHGLALYGVDGTTMCTQDTPALRAKCGGRSGGKNKPSGYPQLRLVALMALGSRLIRNTVWGACRSNEQALAAQLWDKVPPRSLTLLDKGFYNTAVLARWQRECASKHWLIRVKKGTQWKKIRPLGFRDWLVELKVSDRARRSDPNLPKTFRARAVWMQVRGYRGAWLLTSLTDPKRFPREAIAAVYHQRWSQELGWDELKTHLLRKPARPLRSKTWQGVQQEVSGALLAYNLVRREAAQTAAAAGLKPTEISFVKTLRRLQDQWFFWAVTGGAPRPDYLVALWADPKSLKLPPCRADRRYPRAVKVRMTRFPRKPPAPHARRKPDVELQKSWREAA
jgi:hypothetical protein